MPQSVACDICKLTVDDIRNTHAGTHVHAPGIKIVCRQCFAELNNVIAKTRHEYHGKEKQAITDNVNAFIAGKQIIDTTGPITVSVTATLASPSPSTPA